MIHLKGPEKIFVSTNLHRRHDPIFFKLHMQVYLGALLINSHFVLSYLIKYAHNDLISDFSIFGIHNVILKASAFKFCSFLRTYQAVKHKSSFFTVFLYGRLLGSF